MAALPEFQNALSRVGAGTLYSTALTGTASLANASIEFFAYGLSQTGPGFTVTSTLNETNLRSQGAGMPAQQSFVVHGIALSYSYCTTTGNSAHTPISSGDLHNLTDNGTLLSWIWSDGTPVEITNTSMIGSGGGVGAYGVAGTAGGVASELGIGRGIFKLPAPVPLYPLASFRIGMRFPYTAFTNPSGLNIAIRVTFLGQYNFLTPQG
jgi:hypothetical protein